MCVYEWLFNKNIRSMYTMTMTDSHDEDLFRSIWVTQPCVVWFAKVAQLCTKFGLNSSNGSSSSSNNRFHPHSTFSHTTLQHTQAHTDIAKQLLALHIQMVDRYYRAFMPGWKSWAFPRAIKNTLHARKSIKALHGYIGERLLNVFPFWV